MRTTHLALVSTIALLTACNDGDDREGPSLGSACVARQLGLARNIADGGDCFLLGYSDCGAGALASECIHTCAHDVCQAASCSTYADCSWAGLTWDCQDYVISGTSYGRWCGPSPCPRGTPGCPCLTGNTCYQTGVSGQSVSCSGTTCVLSDTCASGCRVGSVCCGGAFCGGNCIGTPCC